MRTSSIKAIERGHARIHHDDLGTDPSSCGTWAVVSPLNWGLEGCYDLFLRGAGPARVAPQALRFILLAAAAMTASFVIQKRKHLG